MDDKLCSRKVSELQIELETVKAQEYVQNHLSKTEQYRQTAEAATDLALACLEYARALEGTNSNDSYWGLKRVVDVYAGLMNTAEIADIPLDTVVKFAKAKSWADELSAGQEEKEAVTLAEAMREKQKLDEETEDLLRPFFPDLEEAKDSSTGIRTRTFFPEEDEEVTEKCSQ